MAAINIVLSEPPGAESQFVEVETDDGRSVVVGHWSQRGHYWVLRITEGDLAGLDAPSR